MASQPGLSESEVEVLKVLWDLGPSTVRAVNRELTSRGRRWAYTTVSTLLLRLSTKGCVAGDSSAVPHVYRATVSRDELVGRPRKADPRPASGQPSSSREDFRSGTQS